MHQPGYPQPGQQPQPPQWPSYPPPPGYQAPPGHYPPPGYPPAPGYQTAMPYQTTARKRGFWTTYTLAVLLFLIPFVGVAMSLDYIDTRDDADAYDPGRACGNAMRQLAAVTVAWFGLIFVLALLLA